MLLAAAVGGGAAAVAAVDAAAAAGTAATPPPNTNHPDTQVRMAVFSAADAIFRRRLLSLHPPHVSHPALPATTTTKPAK